MNLEHIRRYVMGWPFNKALQVYFGWQRRLPFMIVSRKAVESFSAELVHCAVWNTDHAQKVFEANLRKEVYFSFRRNAERKCERAMFGTAVSVPVGKTNLGSEDLHGISL